MADNQGTYRIQIVVDGDDNINARINGLTKGYTTLAKAVDEANAKLRDQNKAHKGTANFYKEQIGYLEDLRDRLAKTTGETNKYNAVIERLEKKKAALSAPMQGTLAAFRLEVQELRKQQAQVAKTSAQWDAYEKKISSVKGRVDALTGSQRMQIKTNKDMISNAGLAGATVVELGRTVSDANYGFTAMANNLSQLSTLFITLVAKTEGGLIPALGALRTQLMGPLGFIILFQVAVTVLEYFAKAQKEAKDATDKLSDSIKQQSSLLTTLLKNFRDINGSLYERAKALNAIKQIDEDLYKFLQRNLFNQEKINKVIAARTELTNANRAVEEKSGELAEKIFARTEESNQRQKKLALEKLELLRLEVEGINIDDAYRARLIRDEAKLKEFNKETVVLMNEQTDLLARKTLAEINYDLILGKNNKKGRDSNKEREDHLAKLQELYDDLSKQGKNRFDKQIEEVKQERDARLKVYDDILAKENLTQEERASFLRARINAEQLATDKINEIEEDRAKFIRETAKKLLKDQERLNAKQLLDNLKSVKDQADIIKAEKYKEAESIIKDKERLAEKLKEIDIEILEFQIAVIKQGMEDGTLPAEEAVKRVAALQIQLTKLTNKAAVTAEEQMEMLKKSAKDFTDALIGAIEMELDAQISREERKTTIQNNALKERLRNENLSANQREAINKRIENNEIALQKKRDELAEKQFKLQKAIAIGQTIITSFEMATRAYNAVLAGPEKFLGISALALAKVAYGTALALGLAQVNAIRRQQFVPSGMSAGSSGGAGGGATVTPPEFNIVGQSASNQVAQAVQGQFEKPVKAYVVSKDITTAQEMDRNIVSSASI